MLKVWTIWFSIGTLNVVLEQVLDFAIGISKCEGKPSRNHTCCKIYSLEPWMTL